MSKRQSRREVLRKSAYVVPTVLTLAVKPSLGSSGSGRYEPQNEQEKGGHWEEHGRSRRERDSKKPKKNKQKN